MLRGFGWLTKNLIHIHKMLLGKFVSFDIYDILLCGKHILLPTPSAGLFLRNTGNLLPVPKELFSLEL